MTPEGTDASKTAKRPLPLLVAGVVLACLAVIAYRSLPKLSKPMVSGHVACASNLKQIGIALHMYASRNDGWFPTSLKALVEQDYLVPLKLYQCPVRKKDSPLLRTGEFICDYRYRVGLRVDLPHPETTWVVIDQPGNHKANGNALFVDGHVKSLAGEEWFVDFE